MNFDLKSPCGECPFRNDKRPFGLRPGRVREILGGGKGRDHWPAVSFVCHKTADCDGDKIPPTAQQCAGVMIILWREQRPNDAMQLGERLGLFDPSQLDMTAPVYESTAAAIAGQGS